MNKKNIPLIFFMLLAATVSCQKKNSDSSITNEQQSITNASTEQEESADTAPSTESTTESLKLFQVDESDIMVLDENDYADAELLSKTNVLLLYKPVINISESYPDMTYESIEFPEGFYPTHCDDNGFWYDSYYEGVSDGGGGNGMIRRYNHETGELSVFLDPEGNIDCTCIGINENYLIWTEDKNNYLNTSLYYVYNFDTGESIKFYEDVINPETDSSYYGLHFNRPVIIDDKIYYDDVIETFEDGSQHIIIYCYDITEDKYEVMYDNAIWPLEYMNKLAWFNRSKDGVNPIFCNQDGGLFKLKSLLGSDAFSCEELIAIHDNMSENTFSKLAKGEHIDTDFDPYTGLPEDEASTSHGIKLFRNGKVEPILLTGNNVVARAVNISTNGRFVTWAGYKIGEPMFYDSEKDALVYVDFFESKELDIYNFNFFRDKLLLTCFNYSGEEQNFLISF